MIKSTTFLVLLVTVFAGCGGQTPSVSVPVNEIVAEPATPAVGSDGKLAQSIGIETLGGVFTPILVKGINVPCSVSEIFSTAEDNQDQIMIKPFRGNAQMVADCDRLGEFQVVGIASAPRGTPQIEITFAVQNGNVLLSARDIKTGRALQIKKAENSRQSASRAPVRPLSAIH